jgi:hypothetical protein
LTFKGIRRYKYCREIAFFVIMKNQYTYLLIALVIASCGDEPKTAETSNQTTPAVEVAQPRSTPADLEKQFDKIIGEYQERISNGFWGEFTSTTRRGGQGTTEKTFDATEFEKFMLKKGFEKVLNAMMDYMGKINDIEVSVINRGATSGEHGGWIQNWTIRTKAVTADGTFEKSKDFSVN